MAKEKKIILSKQITAEEADQCAAEQIQFIGAIQPHGFVLVIDANNYQVVQYSQNITFQIGLPDCLNSKEDNILSSKVFDWVLFTSELPFIELNDKKLTKLNLASAGFISGDEWECLGHLTGAHICLEFIPSYGKKIETDELITTLNHIVTNISKSQGQPQLYDVITNDFQIYTGYDRVMLYKFHSDWSGEVLSESVSDNNTLRFKGLRFPAEDIPKQARELYTRNTLRIIAEVDAETVEMLPALVNKQPVDLGLAMLRSMSKMHIQYLQNMNVKATMTLSLMYKGKLWGLMAFHHNSPKLPPNHVVSQVKTTCELFTEVVNAYLHTGLDLAKVENFMQKKLRLESAFNILDKSKSLHELFNDVLKQVTSVLDYDYIGIGGVDYCACYIGSEFHRYKNDAFHEIMSLIETQERPELFTNSLSAIHKKLTIPGLENIAGLCIVASSTEPRNFLFFGRKEVEKSVEWAGKPGTVDIVVKNGERMLEPRSSFSLWRENVKGYSQDWDESDEKILHLVFDALKDLINFHSNQTLLEKLHHSAHYDALTGLANRQFLKQHINHLEKQKIQDRTVSVFFIDLDNFKEINDFMGHMVGDLVLKTIAKRLQSCVRPNDLVVRLGGDEFLIVIDNNEIENQMALQLVSDISNKVLKSICKPIFEKNHSIVTTPSIGVNICKLSELDFEEIMKQADIALYTAKSEGKNRAYLFSEKDQTQFNKVTQLSHDLREAIQQRILEVHFQPQVNKEGLITGAEALCRWTNETYGPISPDVFIPLAEKNGYIYKLGLLVFELVCKQLNMWSGIKGFASLETVSVNVSPMQILSNGFEEDILKIVDKYGVNIQKIRLEVTETVFMTQFKEVADTLKSLRERGFSISLDDFGTGFSSLSYLVNLPIDEVKIDKSFIANMSDDENSLTMVEGIISLCKKLKLEVVAEGVETKLQYNILKGLGCDTFQGFLFSKPVSGERIFVDPSQKGYK